MERTAAVAEAAAMAAAAVAARAGGGAAGSVASAEAAGAACGQCRDPVQADGSTHMLSFMLLARQLFNFTHMMLLICHD